MRKSSAHRTTRILAREQASAITADAEAKCAEIRAGYDKQAQDQYWARVRDGVKTCEDRVQRMGRLAEMEARKRRTS